MDQERIGNFIKSIRLENHLTQREFADILGVTYQAVSKWENGKNAPDIAIMKLISEKFHVNIDDILNGEKSSSKKSFRKSFWFKIILVFVLFLVVLVFLIFHFWGKPDTFEFTTISSKCADFKITGSAAYNQEKTSIYISNIEFCGKEDSQVYVRVDCTLYEVHDGVKSEISSCEGKDNVTLEEYLKDTNIQVNNYSTMCKNLTSENLFLEIIATVGENQNNTYSIPIKLNDDCK